MALNNKGFTFIEMMIVLIITMVIAVVAFSFGDKGIKSQEFDRFTDQLVIDAMYIQSYAKNKKVKVDIYFITRDHYYIGRERVSNRIIFKKQMPKSIEYDRTSTIATISFNERGNASYVGRIIFRFGKIKKEVYVYLGSGRIFIYSE